VHSAVLPATTPDSATDFFGFWTVAGWSLLISVNSEQ